MGMQPSRKASPVRCLSPALPQKQRKAAEDWRGPALPVCMSLNTLPWASEMAHWVKLLAGKPGGLNLVPGTHVVEGEN